MLGIFFDIILRGNAKETYKQIYLRVEYSSKPDNTLLKIPYKGKFGCFSQ